MNNPRRCIWCGGIYDIQHVIEFTCPNCHCPQNISEMSPVPSNGKYIIDEDRFDICRELVETLADAFKFEESMHGKI